MISATQSLHIQRFAPSLAFGLNILNAVIIILSTLLILLALSLGTQHLDNDTEVFINKNNQSVNEVYKQLDDRRLWKVKPQFGGGVIITNNAGQVVNRFGESHVEIYTILQTLLRTFLIIALVVATVLVASNNFLRLAGATYLIIGTTWQLDIVFLFSTSVGVFTSLKHLFFAMTALASFYWSLNKWLLRNNHISETLIAYASQSGSAMSLAKRLKKSLMHTSDVRCLSTLSPDMLPRYKEVLFIASTYGDGEAPEKAQRFLRKLSKVDSYKEPVSFSVLALGDRTYPHFCAFGHQLEQLMNTKGATPLLNIVEVDRLDTTMIKNWWYRLTQLLNWQTDDIQQRYVSLMVSENSCLNSSQIKRHAHAIKFKGQFPSYQPGDLLEVNPKRSLNDCFRLLEQLGLDENERVVIEKREMSLLHAISGLEWNGENAASGQQLVDQLKPLVPRVYSIVSSPYQESIEIFVRRHRRADGSRGVASNYLCDLIIDQNIEANIRAHSNFHLPHLDVPLILIGAGTGIAPLISFLRHRTAAGSAQRHWLFFGEQYEENDFYFSDEIKQFKQKKVLTRLNLAWSRNDNASYIGEHIKTEQEQILHWVYELGAHIYACGNQSGFGDSVCAELKKVFGEQQYERFIQQGILRTDLY